MMRWSIRYQLLIPLLTLLLGGVAMSVWAALASAHQAREQIENQVRDIARILHDAGFPLTEKILSSMKGLSGADYVLIPRDGHLQTTLSTHNIHLLPPTLKGHEWEHITLNEQVELDGVNYLYSGLNLQQWPNSGSRLYILYPESLWRDAMWQAVRPSLLFGIGGSLAAIVLSIILAQRLTRRVQELERRTRLIAEGDFSPMPLPRRNDELRDLTRSVNEMAQRLAQLQGTVEKNERLRLLGQVSGGLAHQLRNGVAGARLAVQLHARHCKSGAADSRSSQTEDTEALDVALRQLALVEMHLKRFLDLGRKGPLQRQPCSLEALLRDTAGLLRPQCEHAGIELRLLLPEDVSKIRRSEPEASATNNGIFAHASGSDFVMHGDAGQLGQVFLNILTNAIEAAGPGGWVEVQIRPMDMQRAQVFICDSGPGLAPEIAGRLFEPFVTGKRDGVGLGLAVAKQIVEAHQGQIRWERQADRTCFLIELPLT